MNASEAIAAYHDARPPRDAQEAATAAALLAPHAGDLETVRREWGQPPLDRRGCGQPERRPQPPLTPSKSARPAAGSWGAFK